VLPNVIPFPILGGDEMMRVMLYEAPQSMLVRAAKSSWLKAWVMRRNGSTASIPKPLIMRSRLCADCVEEVVE
jgi:hypothetical protein